MTVPWAEKKCGWVWAVRCFVSKQSIIRLLYLFCGGGPIFRSLSRLFIIDTGTRHTNTHTRKRTRPVSAPPDTEPLDASKERQFCCTPHRHAGRHTRGFSCSCLVRGYCCIQQGEWRKIVAVWISATVGGFDVQTIIVVMILL